MSNSNDSLLNDLLSLNGGVDVSGCLANCSNHGDCQLDTNNTYACFCKRNYQGNACQFVYDPCLQSSLSCLNGGTCVLIPNEMDPQTYGFECVCDARFYYGSKCENKYDPCSNFTVECLNGGYCSANNATRGTALCKCLIGYTGEQCEIKNKTKKTVQDTQSYATLIAISIFVILGVLLVGNDVVKLFMQHKEKNRRRIEKKRIIYEN